MKSVQFTEFEIKSLLNAIRTHRKKVVDMGYTAHVQGNNELASKYDEEFKNLNNVADKLFDVLYEEGN